MVADGASLLLPLPVPLGGFAAIGYETVHYDR